jgi:universal stress protein A
MRNQRFIQSVQNYLQAQSYLDNCRREGVDDFAAQEAAEQAREVVEKSLERAREQAVTEPVTRDIKRILVAVQDAEHDASVVDRAGQLARQLGAEVILLHVLEPVLAYATEWDYSPPPDTRRMRTEADDLLELLAGRLPDTKVMREVREGDPTERILTTARDRGVDLIIMGTHGPGRIEQLFMGSTASAVIRQAACPVMVMNRHAVSRTIPSEQRFAAGHAVGRA